MKIEHPKHEDEKPCYSPILLDEGISFCEERERETGRDRERERERQRNKKKEKKTAIITPNYLDLSKKTFPTSERHDSKDMCYNIPNKQNPLNNPTATAPPTYISHILPLSSTPPGYSPPQIIHKKTPETRVSSPEFIFLKLTKKLASPTPSIQSLISLNTLCKKLRCPGKHTDLKNRQWGRRRHQSQEED